MSEAGSRRRQRRGQRPGGPLRRLVIFPARYAGAVVFLSLSFWVGLFWFVLLSTLFLSGLSLLPVLIGFPILALTALAWTFAARLERRWVRLLLGVHIPPPYRHPTAESSRLVRLRTHLLDPATWRDLAYLLLLLPVGLVEFLVVTISLVFIGAFLFSLYALADPGAFVMVAVMAEVEALGGPVVDSASEVVTVVLLGFVLAVAGIFMVRVTARAHAALAVALLSPSHTFRLASPRPSHFTRRVVVVGLCAALVLAAVVLLGRYIPVHWVTLWDAISSPEKVRAFFEGLGAWGPVAFVFVQAAQVVIAIIPAAPVMVAGVAAFGPWWGFFLSLFGTVVGSVVAFAMGRRFGRLMVSRLVGEKVLNKYSGKMAADGWWMLVALMLPLPVGGDAVCALAGLSEISPRRFVVLNVTGRTPFTALTVLAASGLANGSTGLLVGAGVVLALLALVAFLYVRRGEKGQQLWQSPQG